LSSAEAPHLAVVVKGFPRLSETFIARELAALEARGVDFTLHALRHPGPDAKLVDNRVRATPRCLPEYLHDEPLRVMRAFAVAQHLPGFAAAWRAFRRDWPRDRGRARLRRLGQACVLATELPPSVRHLHAHFAHSPTSVVRYAAKLRGLTYSVSAHAKDIWTAPDWDLAEKIADASFVAVCNKVGHARLASLGDATKIQLIHHGLPRADLSATARSQSRDGNDSQAPVRLLCVARAVEKKGLAFLLDALAQMPSGIAFALEHIGGGPLLEPLKEQAQRLGIADRIIWQGSKSHVDVLAALDRRDRKSVV
jgi:glycosyltransferase involved in cell wall biosynthesis